MFGFGKKVETEPPQKTGLRQCPACRCDLTGRHWSRCPRCQHELEGKMGCGGCGACKS